MVAMAGGRGAEEVLDRRRLVIIDPKVTGAAQPYHYVKEMEIRAAQRHLTRCAADSTGLALEALTRVSAELRDRGFYGDVVVHPAEFGTSAPRPGRDTGFAPINSYG